MCYDDNRTKPGEFDGKEPLKTLAKYRLAKDVFPNEFESLDLNKNAVLVRTKSGRGKFRRKNKNR